jgi:hypothetical protein
MGRVNLEAFRGGGELEHGRLERVRLRLGGAEIAARGRKLRLHRVSLTRRLRVQPIVSVVVFSSLKLLQKRINTFFYSSPPREARPQSAHTRGVDALAFSLSPST